MHIGSPKLKNGKDLFCKTKIFQNGMFYQPELLANSLAEQFERKFFAGTQSLFSMNSTISILEAQSGQVFGIC